MSPSDRCPQCGTVHPALSSARAEAAGLRAEVERLTRETDAQR